MSSAFTVVLFVHSAVLEWLHSFYVCTCRVFLHSLHHRNGTVVVAKDVKCILERQNEYVDRRDGK